MSRLRAGRSPAARGRSHRDHGTRRRGRQVVRLGHRDDVADAIQAQWGIVVDRRRIRLDEPVNELSEVEVVVKIHTDIVATLTVAVVP